LRGRGEKGRGEGEHRGEVEEGAEPGDGADELAAPVHQGIEVAGGGEAGLDGAGVGAEMVGGLRGEGEDERRALGAGCRVLEQGVAG
jgi:hypothetical protein